MTLHDKFQHQDGPKSVVLADLCVLTVHVPASFKALAKGQEETKSINAICSFIQCTDAIIVISLLPGN